MHANGRGSPSVWTKPVRGEQEKKNPPAPWNIGIYTSRLPDGGSGAGEVCIVCVDSVGFVIKE